MKKKYILKAIIPLLLYILLILNNKVFAADVKMQTSQTKEISISSSIKSQYSQYHTVSEYRISDTQLISAKLTSDEKKIKVTSLKKEGTVKITFTSQANIHGYSETKNGSITITIVDPEKELERELQKAQETLTNMQNAWKTVPSKNATATQINTFYKSDVLYNQGKNMKKVDKETLKAWQNTINNAKTGAVERALYSNVSIAIYNLLTTGTIGEKVAEETKKAAEAAEEATKSTMKEYLGKLTQSTGEDRVGEFSTDVTTNPTGYKPTDELTGSNKTKLETRISKILTVISNIGIVASVLIIAFLGIKYMVGSVEEKAEYKQDLVPYFVGAILLFGITVFVKIFMSIGNSIMNS